MNELLWPLPSSDLVLKGDCVGRFVFVFKVVAQLYPGYR